MFLRDWGTLYEANPQASPFLSPTWLAQWLKIHEAQLTPTRLLISRVGGDPVAALVLVPGVHRRLGVPFRQLSLNTDGEPPGDSVVVENNAVLALPEYLQLATQTLATVVEKSETHEFIASGIGKEQLDLLCAAFPSWNADVVSRPASLVDLAAVRAADGDLLPLLSANTRAQLRRSLRKFEREGPLRVYVAANGEQAVSFLEELIALHEERWRVRGQKGAFATSSRRLFHIGFVRRAHPVGHAHLLRVCVGERTIGVLYFLSGHGRLNFYQSGFCATQDPHLKPGLVSHYLAIRHFAHSGWGEYDFLASLPDEGRYKRSLATSERSLYWLTLSRPALRNTLVQLVRRLRVRN